MNQALGVLAQFVELFLKRVLWTDMDHVLLKLDHTIYYHVLI